VFSHDHRLDLECTRTPRTQTELFAAVTAAIETTADPIKALAPSMPTKYLRDFFAEKDIPETTFDFKDSKGTWHHMPNVCVVEQIAACPVDSGLRQIESTLRRIDFHNGSVNHFLAHLARGMAEARLQDRG